MAVRKNYEVRARELHGVATDLKNSLRAEGLAVDTYLVQMITGMPFMAKMTAKEFDETMAFFRNHLEASRRSCAAG